MNELLNLPEMNVAPPLTKEVASDLHTRIISVAEDLRSLLWKMYTRDGWRVLGFESWHQYLVNLGEAVDYTHQTLRKITDTAALEVESNLPIGTFKEGAMRPIRDILSERKGYPSMTRVKAVDLAVELAGETDKVTEIHARTAAMTISVMFDGPPRLAERLERSEITAASAYEIAEIVSDESPEVVFLMSEVSDPELAKAVTTISHESPEAWARIVDEVIATGYLPAYDGRHIPLGRATKQDLLDFLNEDNRARRYEEAVDADQLRRVVCRAARDYMLEYWSAKPTEADKLALELWSALEQAKYIIKGD